jgi:hypothetical protein
LELSVDTEVLLSPIKIFLYFIIDVELFRWSPAFENDVYVWTISLGDMFMNASSAGCSDL